MPTPTIQLGEIADIQSGLTTRSVAEGDRGVPVFTMATLSDVRASGRVSPSGLAQVAPEPAMDEPRYRLAENDLIIPARSTAAHLSPVLVENPNSDDDEASPLIINSTVIRIRVNNTRTNPWWVLSWLASATGQRAMIQASQSTSIQLNLNAKSLAAMSLPALPLTTQNQLGEMVQLAHQSYFAATRAAKQRLDLAYGIAFQASTQHFSQHP